MGHFGHRIRLLHWCTEQIMLEALTSMDLTPSQGHIMGYLSHRETPACARDIEEVFQLSHPTVSGILSRLEKKGFLEFRPDPQDRRCKRIYVLDRGKECKKMLDDTIASIEGRIVQDFTPAEQEQFLELLIRAGKNMGCCPKEDDKT